MVEIIPMKQVLSLRRRGNAIDAYFLHETMEYVLLSLHYLHVVLFIINLSSWKEGGCNEVSYENQDQQPTRRTAGTIIRSHLIVEETLDRFQKRKRESRTGGSFLLQTIPVSRLV